MVSFGSLGGMGLHRVVDSFAMNNSGGSITHILHQKFSGILPYRYTGAALPVHWFLMTDIFWTRDIAC